MLDRMAADAREHKEELRAKCKSLHEFVKAAWPVLEPETVFSDNWHIELICNHLEAVTRGEITRLLINVWPGSMKALDEDTPVLTTWGWKRHGDIRAGDFVFGSDGQPKRVKACTPEVIEPGFAVQFDDGTEIIAGAAHEWVIERDFTDSTSLWKRVRRPMIVETRDLLAGARPDRIPISQAPTLPPRQFLIDPYVLGAWLGDGGTNTGDLYVGEQDVEHFSQWAEVGTIYPPSGTRKQTFYRMRVDGLRTRLRVLGLLGDKRIPTDYLTASVEQRWSLLQGLMDTDGCAARNGSCSFTNGNETLAEQCAQLVESLGMKAHRTSRFTMLNGQRYGPHYKVTFAPSTGAAVFRLARKQQRVKPVRSPRAASRYIKAVRPVGPRITKCLQVEGGVYLAGQSLCQTHNSLIVSVLWPAWEWGPVGRPGTRYVSTSFNDTPVNRDTTKTRDLLLSEWYRTLWSEVVLRKKGETSFSNTGTGVRKGVAFGSLTSQRGDRLIIDDPHSVDTAESDVERANTTRRFREGAVNRLNDQEKSAIVIIMQRLHQDDISGEVMKHPIWGYVHVVLPMEFEPERAYRSKWGSDPRTKLGELADPKRFPPSQIISLKESGDYFWAGQYQQRPAPREGGMFKISEDWAKSRADGGMVVEAAPPGGRTVSGWDIAGSKRKTSPYSVRAKFTRVGGDYYIQHVDRRRTDPTELNQMVGSVSLDDGPSVLISLPQDPGAVGKVVKWGWAELLAGLNFKITPETGNKETRAEPYAAQWNAGRVFLVRGAWNSAYIEELRNFPAGSYKDQVDASSRAFSELVERGQPLGVGAPIIPT